MLSALWGRITGKDKRKQYTDQQAEFLGRLGDVVVISPYGLYADLPSDTLLKMIGDGAAISVTVKRPSDSAQGEPVFFHPATNTRIIARNNGDLDVITDSDTAGSINIQTVNANVTASGNVAATCANLTADVSGATMINCPTITLNGNVTVTGTFTSIGAGTMASVSIGGIDFATHVHLAGTPPGNTGTPM